MEPFKGTLQESLCRLSRALKNLRLLMSSHILDPEALLAGVRSESALGRPKPLLFVLLLVLSLLSLLLLLVVVVVVFLLLPP